MQHHVYIPRAVMDKTPPNQLNMNVSPCYIHMALFDINRISCGLYRAAEILPACENMSLDDSQEVLN